MTEDQRLRTAELFHEALARDPEQQLPFLREVCAGDAEMLRRLKDLLDSYAEVRTIEPIPAKPEPQLLDSDTLIALADRYEDIRPIGVGGMGIVLRAYDCELNKVVALKILHPSLADDKGATERFRNEIRLALEITHKNVCRTYGLERVNGKIFISMEYVEGETLRVIFDRRQGVSVPQGIGWTQEICDGLAAAHEKGIVHRDLKPENIMIDRNGHAKVMDFGIARSIEASDGTAGTIIGTPQYMSPEQAMGKATAPTTDIYSFGLVLYEVFTGKRVDSMRPRLPGEVNPLLPVQIDRAISKCLAEDPRDRFQTIRKLAESIRPEAIRRSQTERFAATMRRYGWGFFTAIVAFGLILSATVARRKTVIAPLPRTSPTPLIPKQPGTPTPSSVAQNAPSQSASASTPPPVKAAQPKADNVNVDGAWSATISDAKASAAVQFNLVQNSEGDVVGTYTTSLGGGGSIKASGVEEKILGTAHVGAVDEATIKAYIENQRWDEDDESFKITAPTKP